MRELVSGGKVYYYRCEREREREREIVCEWCEVKMKGDDDGVSDDDRAL